MQPNDIQFAVVREDPRFEGMLLRGIEDPRMLMVASGGCTALTLQAQVPSGAFTLVDPNGAQIDLVQRKVAELQDTPPRDAPAAWNIDDPQPRSLCQCGNFEGLFRQLRRFLHEFVADEPEIRGWFSQHNKPDLSRVYANPYWKAAFDLHLSDSLLNTMFGEAATQHAAPSSYPDYFRKRLEVGLRAPTAHRNYFLHHIFLGHYLPKALPAYLETPPEAFHFEYVQGTFEDVPDLERFDLVNLSNIMDWMSPSECQPMIARICEELRPGAKVLWRELNNDRNRQPWFQPAFTFQETDIPNVGLYELSHFYSDLHIGVKQGDPQPTGVLHERSH